MPKRKQLQAKRAARMQPELARPNLQPEVYCYVPTPAERDREVARENRTRAERVHVARAQIETSKLALEVALNSMIASRIDHPILRELRDAIDKGRRMILHSSEIIKRIP